MQVYDLDFGPKTAKRVAWESWEFTVVGPHLVEVTNASYGHLKDDHSYLVGVEERDGAVVPAECECPADIHREPDCKHKLALATVGGENVLNAAVAFETGAAASPSKESGEMRGGLKTDGGAATVDLNPEGETCPNGGFHCDGPDGNDLPCFECYCERDETDDSSPSGKGN